MQPNPFAFVLMPFSDQFDDIYRLGIKAAATESGIVAERVDEQMYSETMLERIYRQIDAADFIIADLTGRNPNVFYEVGYAHAKMKRCILLTQQTDDIPFDLKHHRHLVYGGKIKKLKDMLMLELGWQKDELRKQKSSTFTITLKDVDSVLSKTKWSASVDIILKIDVHNYTDRRTPDIEAIYLHTGKGWTYYQNGEACPQTESTLERKSIRHFIRSPVLKLSPDGWAQLVVKGSKQMWSTFTSDQEAKPEYRLQGYLLVEIVTSEGTFTEKISIDTTAEEFPF